MVQNVRYLNGLPSHKTIPFEYRTSILSGIQVLGIQLVTAQRIQIIWQTDFGYLNARQVHSKKVNIILNVVLWFQINDNDLISYRQSLTRLPSSRPVKAVFSDFQKYSKKNCPELKVKATTKFIEKVFNRWRL